MKAILGTLLLSTFALGELPPPYSQRGFRPSPQFFPDRQPQTQYGPPKLQSNNIDVNIPSKLTIEQLIRLTERLQNSQIKNTQFNQLNRPQSSYLPPPREPQNAYGPPSKFSQNQLRPQQSFSPSNKPQHHFSNFQSSPQTSYGTPSKVTFSQSNNQPQNKHFGSYSPQGIPQTTYGVPEVQQLPHPSQPGSFGASNNQFNSQNPPSASYGVPDLKSLETLGDLRNQQLPNREPTGFGSAGAQNVAGISQQYLPANVGSQNGAVGNNQNIPQNSGFGGAQGSSQGESQNIPSVNQQYLPPNNFGQSPQNTIGNSQAANNPNSFASATGGSANPNFSSGSNQFGNTVPTNTGNNFGQRPQSAFGNSQAANNPNSFSSATGGSANPNFQSGVNQFGNTVPTNTGNNFGQRPQNAFGNSQAANNANSFATAIGGPSNTNFLSVVNQFGNTVPTNKGNNFGQRPQNAFGTSQAVNNPNSFGSASGGSANPNFPTGVNQFGNTGEGSASNGGGAVNNLGNGYLPPQTTPRTVSSATTIKPKTAATTPATPEGTNNYDYDYDQQPTEASSNDDESAAGPNVAVSNAVAGPGGFFYLQQPDGRLQKVVLQKTQEPNSKPEEYVANYYFQNLQQLPAVTYAPLISLGAWK